MNRVTLIVKLLENPNQSFFEDDICVTEVLVEFTTKHKKLNRGKNVIQISAWGEQGKKLALSYKIGDFLIVEGLISLRPLYLEHQQTSTQPKIVEITIVNFYPYLLFQEESVEEKNSNSFKLEEDNLPF